MLILSLLEAEIVTLTFARFHRRKLACAPACQVTNCSKIGIYEQPPLTKKKKRLPAPGDNSGAGILGGRLRMR